MFEIANLAIGFVGGILAVIGTYLAVRQYRDSQPSIVLIDKAGSGLLSPEAEEKGYTWCFHLSFQNRRGAEYAITDIRWAPRSKRLAKKMAGQEDGWQNLIFDGVLERPAGRSREPLVLAPFEYRQIEGYWKNWWVGDPRSESAERYWRENPDSYATFKRVLESLHNGKVRFRIDFADGRQLVCK